MTGHMAAKMSPSVSDKRRCLEDLQCVLSFMRYPSTFLLKFCTYHAMLLFFSVRVQWHHKHWRCEVSAGCWHTALLSHPDTGCHVWFLDKMQTCSFYHRWCMIYYCACVLNWWVCVCAVCVCCVCVCVCLGAVPELVSLKLVSLWWMLRAARLSKLIPLHRLSNREWQTQPWRTLSHTQPHNINAHRHNIQTQKYTHMLTLNLHRQNTQQNTKCPYVCTHVCVFKWNAVRQEQS